jgi:alpha-2-macroglobulin
MMSRYARAVALLIGLLLAVQCAHQQPALVTDNLPPLKVDPFAGLAPMGTDETQPFTFRKGPAPPPDVSERVQLPFPAPPAPGKVTKPTPPELQVLRNSPVGTEGLVGSVNATFNQPMVPVAALDELRTYQAPLEITPRAAGRFRWLGTETVTFEPEKRMPFGTRYVARIPAGTKAQSGARLEQEVRWEFSTPRVELVEALPSRYDRQVKPDTAIAFLFNQPVDGKLLLQRLKVKALGAADLELVPQGAWAKLKYIGPTVATWEAARTIVVKPRSRLTLHTGYNVEIAPGLRGEGPLPTTRSLTHYFQTYGPLRVESIRCSDYSRCDPEYGFSISFSNPVVTPEMTTYIKVKPAPADLAVSGSGSHFSLRGTFAARKKYSISVLLGPKDVHDQSLEAASDQELTTGDRGPALTLPAYGHAVLESRSARQVPLQVTSITEARMRLVRVHREQLLQVIEKARYSWDDEGRKDPLDGIKGIVVKRTLKTGVPINVRSQIGLSTDEGLGRGAPGVLYIELRAEELRRHYKYANPYRGLVVSVTDIGLMVRYAHDQIIALVTGLESGKPLGGARLELRSADGKVLWQGKSDAGGVAVLPGRRDQQGRPPYVLWAEKGKDSAFAVLDGSDARGEYISSYSSWGYAPAKKRLKVFLFTERNPYRPGETVHLKGVLRQEDTTPEGGIEAIPPSFKTVSVKVQSPRGNQVLEAKQIKLTPSGAFTVDVPIAPGADLGYYNVYVTSVEGSAYGSFQVEEYRAPEFEVKVEVGEGPFFFGDTLKAKIGADYLFGAPMSGAEARWTLRRDDASFTPPKNDGFSFGESVPWFFRWQWAYGQRGGRHGGYAYSPGASGALIKDGKGMLDPSGRMTVEQRLEANKEEKRIGPAAFTLEGEVVDQNRQTIANRKVITVHPASVYVGLRPEKSVIKAGEPTKLAAVLADLEGKRVVGTALRLRALQIQTKVTTVKEGDSWSYKYESKEVEITGCDVTTAADPASCEVTLSKPGMYLLRSEAKDGKGRLARTTTTIYVYGPGYVPWQLENQSKIELVPDRESYRPGDLARVLVKSPFAASLGLLTFSRAGIVQHKTLEMKGNAQVVEVPITDRNLPELYVGVALSRGRLKDAKLGKAAQDLGRPTFAHGEVRLPVSIKAKEITVAVEPQQPAVKPGGTLDLKLRTTDSQGQGVAGELAVMVVDEGVLSLLSFTTPDPLAFFWSSRGAETALQDNRNSLLKREKKLRTPPPPPPAAQAARPSRVMNMNKAMLTPAAPAVAEAAPRRAGYTAVGGKGKSAYADDESTTRDARGGEGKPGQPIRSRSLFATTAYYNPSVVTDETGAAALKIKMPDNLTTFRIMAVALDRGQIDRFGKGQAQVKVRKALLLRPSLPRFLSVGDTFEAAVMVHNETDREGRVDVLVRGRNVKAGGATRKQVQIAAHRATEVRFAMAPVTAGPARIQFAAVLGDDTDAVEKQIPVLLPATTEAFATYGMTDTSIAQSVVPPADALPGYGGLEISMSSTALNGMEDSVRYLVEYPFECTEQMSSRLLPIFSLKDILRDFKIAKLGDLKAQKELAEGGVRKLLSYQRWDGGWGMWPGSQISWPYLTAYAIFTLQRAKEAGYTVPSYPVDRGAGFLKQILDYPRSEFGEEYNLTAQAISVWALSELKRHERKHAKRLYGERHRLPLFAKVWLMQAMFRADGQTAEVKELLRDLSNKAVLTASAAHFSEIATESLRLLMHSEERTDAIALYALLEVDPWNALMPKLARGLIQSRVKGVWSTTQSNAYALTALARYYKQVEKIVPDYVASLWLGEKGYLGQSEFKGRQMRVVQHDVPLAALQQAGKEDLILNKTGPGKLYYRIGLRYAPKNLRLPPEEQGFALTRTYEPVEGKKDTVTRDKDGTWRIKAGSYVRVRLTVVVPDRRYFVAVMDPLPAGLEGVNLSFATTASSRLGNEQQNKVYDFFSWYSLFAFDHREMRDESVVLFSDRLPSGVYEYTYLARATTFGRFVAAPTKAEEMYHPETFGRTATAIVEVY